MAAGAAVLVWLLLCREPARKVDPQTEVDRRITELEDSLVHLQDTFGHVANG